MIVILPNGTVIRRESRKEAVEEAHRLLIESSN